MTLGDAARRSGLYDVIEPTFSRMQQRKWKSGGRPIPAPSAVKRTIIRDTAAYYGVSILVETGTYKADTVRALRSDFERIYSIEIADGLYASATARCRRQSNAILYHGDSADHLLRIVPTLDGAAIFWLDAHKSGGETGGDDVPPILTELQACLVSEAGHVILIDDMREFGSDPNYPTVVAIENLATAKGYDFEIVDDIARLVPRDIG